MPSRCACGILMGVLTVLSGLACAGGPVVVRPDVCVVGGGSAGIGAALAAARGGANVVLVERQDGLGGTSTRGYVSNWEPSPGGPLAREIYDRLCKRPRAVGIVRDHNDDRSKGSFGLWLMVPGQRYEQTLHRIGLPRKDWRAVTFDPDQFAALAKEMLAETGRCRVLLNTTFLTTETEGRRVVSIGARSADGTTWRIAAKVFIDCTGGGFLCKSAGCEMMLGAESFERFREPAAPPKGGRTLNAISLCYRVRRSKTPVRQPPPAILPVGRFSKSAHVSELPDGDLIVNPLGIVPGRALIDKGYAACMTDAKQIVQAHWRRLQEIETFSTYEFHSYAPMLGIRESYRVVGEYILTQHDLAAGLSNQKHPDLVAVVEHPMDMHGSRAGQRDRLKEPYGVPYRCLVPKGWENLLVAGRCASFSHLAASSCRLSRNMLALGRAAGAAAAMSAESGTPPVKIDPAALRKHLRLDKAIP